jgi:hypothetical protein
MGLVGSAKILFLDGIEQEERAFGWRRNGWCRSHRLNLGLYLLLAQSPIHRLEPPSICCRKVKCYISWLNDDLLSLFQNI